MARKKTVKKTVRKTPARNKAARKTIRLPRPNRETNPAAQRTLGDYEVGYCKPPVEHQFKPGQSGNPNGPPRARTNLWPTLCRFLALDDKDLKKISVRKKELRMVELVALKLVSQLRRGVPPRGVAGLVKQMIERDEGKPNISVQIEAPDLLSPQECEQIRQQMRRNLQSP